MSMYVPNDRKPDGRASLRVIHPDTSEEEWDLSFFLRHDSLYSDSCPLCVQSKKHILMLFEHLDGAVIARRGANVTLGVSPVQILWYDDESPTLEWLITTIVANLRDTFHSAHIEDFEIERAETREEVHYDFVHQRLT